MSQNHHRRALVKLVTVTALFILISFVQYAYQQTSSVQLAVAKGNALLAMNSMPQVVLDPMALQTAVSTSPSFTQYQQKNVEFINALPMSYGEAKPWRTAGCEHNSCAQVLFYNHTDGGTINSVVDLTSNEVLDTWQETAVRPAGSQHILPRAMEIAAADERVTAVLGNIGDANPAMVPMSAWLADNECSQDWCVDLTFLDPAGSGRVFHTFVNMTRNEVARTFYTRSRPILDVPEPISQRGAYEDGCNKQYGWDICWEMTAHDGINFRDASFNETPIFSSIKITQIEAWYPSWPGGYRDEIGFRASVPPFGGTEVVDLGNGFELRQLFTEFTRWPNCICCYRYEEVLRLLDDGTFETRFVSHGPGCDDLSIYRPFWRIDLDLNDSSDINNNNDNDSTENNDVGNIDTDNNVGTDIVAGTDNIISIWQADQWVEAKAEQEIYPFFDDVSPTNERIVVSNGNLNYHISMDKTDPLGLDEARFFILQENEGEGEGPTSTGPGDTFQPPRQWINDDPISGEKIIFWYVPLLKTKKGGPWWCVPDPEPGINQCEAILRFAPGDGPIQPSEEELTQLSPPTVAPTAGPTQTPAPTPTPRSIEGETPEEIILNAGCGACHAIGALGEAGKVGPDLSAIGIVANDRIDGMSATDYIVQSIIEPNAFITPECPNGTCFANIMPSDYTSRLSSEQINTMVLFLLSLDGTEAENVMVIGEGETAVIAKTAQAITPLSKAFPAKQSPPIPLSSPTNTGLFVQLALMIILFLLTLFMLIKQK